MPVNATVEDAFRTIDETLCRTVGEILDLVAVRGRMNLDFADVRAVLQGGGAAAVGIGRAVGENRAVDAAHNAMAAALPARSKSGPSSILVNLAGSNKLRLAEVDAVTETVLAAAGPQANLVFGMSVRPRLRDAVQVTVIATGLEKATSADASGEAAGEAVAAWRPVWLRRAPAGNEPAAPNPRPRRRGATRREADAPAATETTAADST
jgi:cell division protein FtsZ